MLHTIGPLQIGQSNDQDQSWTKLTSRCAVFKWAVSMWSVGLCSLINRDALVVAKRIASIIVPYRNRATRLKKNGSKRIWTYLLVQSRPILGTRVVIFG